jgi:Flp pilus assembly protein TadD
MADWRLYGSDPSGHHLTNLCLHAANAVLLFLLLLYMTGYSGRSALAAFLFALHPAHVESVAWIAERKDLLCTFFWFGALLAYARYVRKPSWKRYALMVCAFACALLSKPMAVTLPFTLLLLDFWPLRRISFGEEARAHWLSSLGKLCLEKWPLFIMAAISSVVTFVAQRAGGSVIELQALPLWMRICNAPINYCRYLRIAFWPDPLTAFYYYDANSSIVFAAVLAAIALILITAACWHFRKDKPYCMVGWLWFLGTLMPVIGIVQVGVQSLAERYTYVSLTGIFVAIVWLAGDAVANKPKMRATAQLLAVAVLAACALKTEAQVKVWKNTETLFRNVLAVDPRGATPNTNLAMVYLNQGRTAEAQEYFERALVYNPSAPQVLSFSAYCIMQNVEQTGDAGKLPLAGQRLQQALRLAPGDPDVLANLALWSALMGRPKDEEAYSGRVIASHPDFANLITVRLYLADALKAQGKLGEAVQAYRQALAIEPDNYNAHNNLGILFDGQGLEQAALKEFRISLSIKPDQSMTHYEVGRILAKTQQFPEAVEEFIQALKLDPANAYAHNDLGIAMVQRGDLKNAYEQFSEAVQIDPSYADARRNLERLQAMMKHK